MSEALRERAEALLAVVAEHERVCVGAAVRSAPTFERESRLWWPRYIAAAREELEGALTFIEYVEKEPSDRRSYSLSKLAEAIVSRWEKALGVRP